LYEFHLKFTINAIIAYTAVATTFSTSILCPNHHSQYFNSWSIVSQLIWSQLYNRMHFRWSTSQIF